MLPPTDEKHALLCGIVTGTLDAHLPSKLKRVSIRLVNNDKGVHLAGCLIEVDDDVYELEIRSAATRSLVIE